MKNIGKPSFAAPLLALVIFGFTLSSRLLVGKKPGGAVEMLLTLSIIQIAVFVLPAVFYLMLKRKGFVRPAMIYPFAPTRLVLLAAMLGVMLTGSLLINLAVYSLSGNGAALDNVTAAAGSFESRAGVFTTVVAVCVMPAVCEEFAFRGVILGQYRYYGATAAVLASSLLFAMSHFSLINLPSQLFCGAVLGSLTLITRSLPAAMVLHAAYNVCSLFFIPYVRSILFEPMGTLFTVFFCAGLFFVFLVFAFAEIQAVYHDYARRPERARERANAADSASGAGEERPSFTKGLLAVFTSPSYITCIAVYILFTLIIKLPG